jgi:prepilin-type N-terminal cleavage/methylation domain-containing protein
MSSEMHRTAAVRLERGYSLIEVMLVVTLTGILGAMAVLQIGAARPSLQADGAMRTVMGQLNRAREQAITERRRIEVQIDVEGNVLRLTRQEVPDGAEEISAVGPEAGVKLGPPSGMTLESPEFDEGTDFAGDTTVMFNTDGSLIDESGMAVNGTIFLAVPNVGNTVRAITVQGSTGRVKGFRYNGTTWTRG